MAGQDDEPCDPVAAALARFSASLDRLADGLEASVRLQEVQRLRTDHLFDALNERRIPPAPDPAPPPPPATAPVLPSGNPPLLPTPTGAGPLDRRLPVHDLDRAQLVPTEPRLDANRAGFRTPTAGHDNFPRIRIDAPRFNGSDPQGWIFKVQAYYDYYHTTDFDRLQLVGLLIDHPASDWFRYYQQSNGGATWQAFLRDVRQRFDPHFYEDYVGLLAKLQQKSTVLDYQTEFEALLNKVTRLSEPTLISLFKAGLKQPIQREVNLRNPVSLAQAFALARELAASLADTTAGQYQGRRWSPTGFRAPPPPSVSPGPPLPANQSLPPPRTTPAMSQLPIRRLSIAERAERQKKGLCFNCDEQYVVGHRCKHRFLALLGTDESEDDEPIDIPFEELVVAGDVSSIHSMEGIAVPRSLKVFGTIHSLTVQVLIDGGST